MNPLNIITGHFAILRPGGWVTGYQFIAADFANFEQRSVQAINGDLGGCWAPATPIVLNGFNAAIAITGPVRIGRGARLTTLSGARVKLQGSAWPLLGPYHTGRNRSLVTSLLHGRPLGQNLAWLLQPNLPLAGVALTANQLVIWDGAYVTGRGSALPSTIGVWAASTGYAAGAFVITSAGSPNGYIYECTTPGTSGSSPPSWSSALTPGQTVTDGSVTWTNWGSISSVEKIPSGSQAPAIAALWECPLDVHQNGTIASVTVTYRANAGQPKARVIRYDLAGGTPTPLCSTAVGADANGWVTAAAIDTGETVQTWTIQVDGGAAAANAIVDRSQYTYRLEVQEDASLGTSLAVLAPVRVATTGQIDVASPPSTVDGVTLGPYDFVLVKNQGDPTSETRAATSNGIYMVPPGGGSWVFYARADTVNQNVPTNAVVAVLYGAVNGGTYWQNQGNFQAQQDVANNPIPNAWLPFVGGVPVGQGAFAATGNVYIAAAVNHADIADNRFQ